MVDDGMVDDGMVDDGMVDDDQSAVGYHGLVVLPFLGSERSPGWRDDARGTIHGMTRRTTARDIQQAMYESVCLRLRSIMMLMSSFVDEDAVVLASGTALKSNPVWKQMMADALGKPLVVENSNEDTSRGVTVMVVKSLLKRDRLMKETLDLNAQVWTCKRSEEYGHELKKQEELYDKLYDRRYEERKNARSKSWLVEGHVVGAAVVCGVILGYALSYLRRK
jgi:gluconokinase